MAKLMHKALTVGAMTLVLLNLPTVLTKEKPCECHNSGAKFTQSSSLHEHQKKLLCSL